MTHLHGVSGHWAQQIPRYARNDKSTGVGPWTLGLGLGMEKGVQWAISMISPRRLLDSRINLPTVTGSLKRLGPALPGLK